MAADKVTYAFRHKLSITGKKRNHLFSGRFQHLPLGSIILHLNAFSLISQEK